MIPIGKKLDQETICHGNFNKDKFELKGGGAGEPYEGRVSTFLESTGGPLTFPTALLSPILIMGYPTFSHYHLGCHDLFKISNGYEYERHFKLENGGKINTLHKIKYDGTKLNGDFHVLEADCKVPNLVGIEPAIETFIPAGPGKIRSKVLIAWRQENGELFTADVESEYRLTHTAELPFIQFRHIDFDVMYTPTSIKQSESLQVFREFPTR